MHTENNPVLSIADGMGRLTPAPLLQNQEGRLACACKGTEQRALVAADWCHDDSIAEAPVRKLFIIKPVQGLPGCTQPSHTLEVDGKGRKGVSKGGEGPRHRPMAGAGEDAGLELGPGVTITTGHAR